MPETQLIVERQNYKEKKIREYDERIRELNEMIYNLNATRNELHELRQNVFLDIDIYEDGDEENTNNQKSSSDSVPNKLIDKCTNDHCRGFLSSKWKCNLCNTWTCNKCYVNIGTNDEKKEHICDENALQTAKLIKKDCKSCPKCSILIFKINGCDQMYCTQCHTAFSWKSGIIETGVVHNPHYYEYLRMTGANIPRNPLDVAERNCDPTLNNQFLNGLTVLFNLNLPNENKHRDLILNICNKLNHLEYSVVNRLRNDNQLHDIVRENNRIKYLKNMISEEEFKRTIQINEKKYQKNQELINLYVMVYRTSSNIIHMLYEKINEMRKNMNSNQISKNEFESISINKIYEVLDELKNLQIYANECLANISKTYHCVHKWFDDSFTFYLVPKNKRND